MKAAVNTKYGDPSSVLNVTKIPKPIPKDDELLINVHASSVNRTDCGFLRAKPAIVRLFSGLTKPRRTILGCEFAGVVEIVGSNVRQFKAGDRVFGFDDVGFGGHGAYMTIPEKRTVALIPSNIDFIQAAISTEGSHYALSYVRAIKEHKAQTVLVNGATGAIGTAAVQLLKNAGLYVVATSDTKNVKLVKSLGADLVIDREKEDFTKTKQVFDAVFDAVGKSSFKACLPLLREGGLYISTELGYLAQNPLLALISPVFKVLGAKRVIFPLPKANKEIIEFLKGLLETREFKPVIDKTYSLDKIIEAYNYVEKGQKTGNVAIVHK